MVGCSTASGRRISSSNSGEVEQHCFLYCRVRVRASHSPHTNLNSRLVGQHALRCTPAPLPPCKAYSAGVRTLFLAEGPYRHRHCSPAGCCNCLCTSLPGLHSWAAMQEYVVNENGEKVLVGSRRPDGTIRKERRIRAGYIPQDEQTVYESRGMMVRYLHMVSTGWSAAAPCSTEQQDRV